MAGFEMSTGVTHEQILEARDLLQLVNPGRHMVRRSDQQIPRLQELPVELGAGNELLTRIGEHLSGSL
jgi:hypothetical protein